MKNNLFLWKYSYYTSQHICCLFFIFFKKKVLSDFRIMALSYQCISQDLLPALFFQHSCLHFMHLRSASTSEFIKKLASNVSFFWLTSNNYFLLFLDDMRFIIHLQGVFIQHNQYILVLTSIKKVELFVWIRISSCNIL